MKFRTVISRHGNNAGVPVPSEVVEKLNAGKRPKVVVTINTHTYRSSVASMGGEFLIALSAENRRLAGVEPGDSVQVMLRIDDAPRDVEVPPELETLLKRNAACRKAFDALSYSRKAALVAPIVKAKTDVTRRRNAEKAMTSLIAGSG